jgi:hypothetical protein
MDAYDDDPTGWPGDCGNVDTALFWTNLDRTLRAATDYAMDMILGLAFGEQQRPTIAQQFSEMFAPGEMAAMCEPYMPPDVVRFRAEHERGQHPSPYTLDAYMVGRSWPDYYSSRTIMRGVV